MKRILKYFVEGLMLLVPIAGSILVVLFIVKKIDGIFGLPIPGAGVALTLVLITLTGMLASNFITKVFLRYLDNLLKRLPVFKIVYTSIKDLLCAFVGDKKSFDKPVSVIIDKSTGAEAIGFITQESLDFLGSGDKAAVYFPQSYNFSGDLVLYPKELIRPLSISGNEALAFIISGGVSAPGKNR